MRQTCFAVQDDGLHLHSVLTQGNESGDRLSKSSIELANQTNPVVHLDLVPTESERAIIVLQEDGTITRATADLADVASARLPCSPETSQMTLLTACCLLLQDAARSVLKSRSDITKTLPEGSVVIPAVGFAAVENTQRLYYSVWCLLPNQKRTLTSTSFVEVQLLFQHDLTSSNPVPLKGIDSSNLAFGPRASRLYMKTKKAYLTYKLDATVPTKVSSLDTQVFGATDIDTLSISSTELLIASPESLQIVDAKYEVPHAALDLRKRKQPGSTPPGGNLDLLGYYSQLRRIVARKGQTLIAIDIRVPDETNTKQARASRLASSIGRGVAAANITQRPKPLRVHFAQRREDNAEAWLDKRAELDQMLKTGNIESFEEAALDQLHSSQTAPVPHDSAIDFILTRMFSIVSDPQQVSRVSSTQMRVNFRAPRLIRWFSSAGHLSVWRLRKSLRSECGQHTLQALVSDSISRALYNEDESADLLLTHVRNNANVDVEEQLSVIKFLINFAKVKSAEGLQESSDFEAEAEPHPLVRYEWKQSGSQQVPTGSAMLPPALLQSIILSMNRLAAFDHNDLASNLRASHSIEDIMMVIQFLRQQLFQSGHASWLLVRTDQESPDAVKAQDIDQTLTEPVSFEAIVKILSACLDSIGPLQLLSTGLNEQSVGGIIPDLLSEVELSAQYIEESAELQGVLRETLRYCMSRASKTSQRTVKAETTSSHKMGEIVSMYSENAEDGTVAGLAGTLPLSLRDDEHLDSVRVRKGGGRVSARSTREMLMLEGRQKGPYIFERLIL
jgi:hypothetical protein